MTERPHVTASTPVGLPPGAAKFPLRSIILLAGAGFASQAMVRVTDSLLPQIAADFDTTVGQAAIVIAAYSVAHGSVQLIIGPIADRFGKYRTVAVMCALATVLVAICGMATTLSGLAAGTLCLGRGGRLDHPDLHGLCRRRHATRAYPAGARALSLGPDHRPALRPGRGRRARRPVRLAQRLLRAGRHFRARHRRTDLRALDQSAHARRRPRGGAAALRRRLRGGAVESLGALRHSRRLHRGERGLGRLRLCGRRPASALRTELHGDRIDRRRHSGSAA